MHVADMTKKQFYELPLRSWGVDIGPFGSLVILPSKEKSESGFRCMDFVAVAPNGEPICRLSGGSDVIHIGGVGFSFEPCRRSAVAGWSMDSLSKSGLLRLFAPAHALTCGPALSSFEVYAHYKPTES